MKRGFLFTCCLTVAVCLGATSHKTSIQLKDARETSPALADPVRGFTARTSDGELRPIVGNNDYLGLGPRVAALSDADRIVVSPSQDYALARTKDGVWNIVLLRNTGAEPVTLRSAAAPDSMIALSNSGTSAVLYSAAEGKLEVYSGLPASPALSFSAAFQPSATNTIALAVDDAGKRALAAWSDGNNGAIDLITSEAATPAELGVTAQVSAIRFVGTSGQAVAVDRRANNLLSIDIDASAVRILADARAGLNAPSGLAVDAARKQLYIANTGGRSVTLLSLSGEPLMLVDCPFEPDEIALVPGTNLATVTARGNSSFWLLRTTGSEGQISFLPSVD